MDKKRIKIPRDASREDKLKIVADRIYTDAETWIRACQESDGLLAEFCDRINERLILRPSQR